jgi:hypothetical protein
MLGSMVDIDGMLNRGKRSLEVGRGFKCQAFWFEKRFYKSGPLLGSLDV